MVQRLERGEHRPKNACERTDQSVPQGASWNRFNGVVEVHVHVSAYGQFFLTTVSADVNPLGGGGKSGTICPSKRRAEATISTFWCAATIHHSGHIAIAVKYIMVPPRLYFGTNGMLCMGGAICPTSCSPITIKHMFCCHKLNHRRYLSDSRGR